MCMPVDVRIDPISKGDGQVVADSSVFDTHLANYSPQ